jgi:GT2 family glycosyltransferase
MKKIAVLLTCYNRIEKTLNCLNSFYNSINKLALNITFDIYMVDDGSTDGTSKEISKEFPEIYLIKGSGDLYWAGGMRLAWETALKKEQGYDSFLLLNDDVILTESFFADILSTHEYCLDNFNQSGIYVSSTKDMVNSKVSYGGRLITHKGIKIRSKRIFPSEIPILCSMANANILMVTMTVVKAIGILDKKFIHRFADYDYTLNASKHGIPVLVCPGYGGLCDNDHSKTWLSSNSSLKERAEYLYSPLGLAYKEQLFYLRKNFKFQLPYYFLMLWLKTIFPFIWDKFKKY